MSVSSSWSVSSQWLRSSSVSTSEKSSIWAKPAQVLWSSVVWLRSSSPPRALHRDTARLTVSLSLLTGTRDTSWRRTALLALNRRIRAHTDCYEAWTWMKTSFFWCVSLCGLSNLRRTPSRTGSSRSSPLSSTSQSCRSSCVFLLLRLRMVETALQSSAVRLRVSLWPSCGSSTQDEQDRSSLCCTALSRSTAAPCWTSEAAQQWTNLSSRFLSTLGGKDKIINEEYNHIVPKISYRYDE